MLIGSLGHSVSLLASSFVEEEHQTFYFLTTTLYIILFVSFFKTFQVFNQENSNNGSEGWKKKENLEEGTDIGSDFSISEGSFKIDIIVQRRFKKLIDSSCNLMSPRLQVSNL